MYFPKRRTKQSFSNSDLVIPEGNFGTGWIFEAIFSERLLTRDILVASTLSMIFTLAPAFIAMAVIDRVLINRSESTVAVLLSIFICIVILEMIVVYVRGLLIEQLSARVDAKLNLFVMDRLLHLPISYYDNESIGITLNKLENLQRIRQFFGNPLFVSAVDVATLIGIIPSMVFINPLLSVFALICMGGIFAIVCLFRPLIWNHFRSSSAAQHERSEFLTETVYGMRIVKFLSIEQERQQTWDAKAAKGVRENYRRGVTAARSRTALVPFERMMYAGSVILGGALVVASPGGTPAGTLIAFAMLAGRAAAPIMQIASFLPELGEVKHAIEELGSVVNAEPETTDATPRLRPRVRGRITFQDVHFRYPRATRDALTELHFDIPPGTYLGIVGRSGSGKTTISRLIQGANKASAGAILIDGVDSTRIDLPYLRAHIGFVAQDDMIFKGTIRENIAFGRRGASLKEVEQAARLAGAHEFIEDLPDRYDSQVLERGQNFSGGQRQRIAIARALISDPKILILDEATSALDSESEAIINNTLKRLAKDRTIIAISHRLSMLRHCDQIMVLNAGRMLDLGDHGTLMTRCKPYRDIWMLHADSHS